MAPNRENIIGSSYPKNSNGVVPCNPRLSIETIQRAKSDISFVLSKETIDSNSLPTISEVEDAKCECCGMCEECTTEYINRVREKFSGKMICGLCSEAVNEEMEKNGRKREEALEEHMNACVTFNRFGRTHPVLYQAEAMREILRNSRTRAKSMSPKDKVSQKKGAITRSSSCIPAIITKEISKDQKMVN